MWQGNGSSHEDRAPIFRALRWVWQRMQRRKSSILVFWRCWMELLCYASPCGRWWPLGERAGESQQKSSAKWVCLKMLGSYWFHIRETHFLRRVSNFDDQHVHRRFFESLSHFETTNDNYTAGIPIPIGSMYGIYMLTFGVYWWNPCYHIYHTWILWDMISPSTKALLAPAARMSGNMKDPRRESGRTGPCRRIRRKQVTRTAPETRCVAEMLEVDAQCSLCWWTSRVD